MIEAATSYSNTYLGQLIKFKTCVNSMLGFLIVEFQVHGLRDKNIFLFEFFRLQVQFGDALPVLAQFLLALGPCITIKDVIDNSVVQLTEGSLAITSVVIFHHCLISATFNLKLFAFLSSELSFFYYGFIEKV